MSPLPRTARSAFSQLLLGLALLAALFHAALPAGVMAQRDQASGAVEVVLCAEHGAMRQWFDPATGEWSDSDPGQGEERTVQPLCAAAAHDAPLLTAALSEEEAPDREAEITPRLVRTFFTLPAHAPPPPARAPPMTV